MDFDVLDDPCIVSGPGTLVLGALDTLDTLELDVFTVEEFAELELGIGTGVAPTPPVTAPVLVI